jgi:MYXO-CTERM domain-containing protein
MKLRHLSSIFGLLLVSLLGAHVRAQQYPPQLGDVAIRDADGRVTNVFAPGEIAEITASGLLEDTVYDFLFVQSPPVQVGEGRTDSTGYLRSTFRVPRDARPGPATLTLDPRGVAGANQSIALRILQAQGSAEDAGPQQDQPIALYVGLGVAAALAAGALVLHRRRRHSRFANGAGEPNAEDRTARLGGRGHAA